MALYSNKEAAMTLDDVYGPDQDRFPLEQEAEDWDAEAIDLDWEETEDWEESEEQEVCREITSQRI
jgi:hypothetical protein